MEGPFIRLWNSSATNIIRRQNILPILLIAVYFLYNSTIMQTQKDHTKKQDDTFGNAIEPTLKQCIHGDTSIIITTSWIKSFPTLYFIREVVDSLSMLNGISSMAPIIITVDGMKITNPDDEKEILEYQKKQQQLDSYVEMLHNEYHNHTNIHIFTSIVHQHISGSVRKALNLVELHYGGCIEFLYYIQHDFPFVERIDHASIVKTAKENDSIHIIRFLLQSHVENDDLCRVNKTPVLIETNNISLAATSWYSDNNHFAKFSYYKSMIYDLGPNPRPPEGPRQYEASHTQNCTDLKWWCYMDPSTGNLTSTINHLDGRGSNIVETHK